LLNETAVDKFRSLMYASAFIPPTESVKTTSIDLPDNFSEGAKAL
jgi:hypothetical protein